MDLTYQRRARLIRILRIFFTGLALLLTVDITILLIVNLSFIFGKGDIVAHIFPLLFVLAHSFLLVLILAPEIVLVLLMALWLAEPLAILAFLYEVRKAQKRSYREYFPLEALPLITPEYGSQNPGDLVDQSQQEKAPILALIRRKTHLLLTGVPGAGKTTVLNVYQHDASKHYWSILRSRDQLPIYIPMDSYSLFLESMQQPSSDSMTSSVEDTALFQFLLTEEKLPAMHHVRPYLKGLIEQGRLLFLCDGLNEVNGTVLPVIRKELSWLMHQSSPEGNRFVMTCRELDYIDQFELRRLVIENRVERATIHQLEDRSENSQVGQFVEAYVYKSGTKLRYSKEQFLEVINYTGLRRHCTNPMMLSTLIKIIDDIGMDDSRQLSTRGRLMEQYVLHLIRRQLLKSGRGRSAQVDGGLVPLLSEAACAVRWASDLTTRSASSRRAVQLNVSVSRNSRAYYRNLADQMTEWLDSNHAKEPFIFDKQSDLLLDLEPAHEQLSESLPELIAFAQRAGLVDISASGELRFQHELLAEYFVAEYFRMVDNKVNLLLPLRVELLEDVGCWKEPVALWAGLIDDPIRLADLFATLGKNHPDYISQAATLSLTCIGVLWTSGYGIELPQSVLEVLAHAVRDEKTQKDLARQLNECAQTGGQEVYQSLLPLLSIAQINRGFIKGVEGLLAQLDKPVVPELLLNYLEEIINHKRYEREVQSLISVLGRFGAAAVTRAIELSQPETGRSQRMRIAAIIILGRADHPLAVAPLVRYLGEQDTSEEQYLHKTTKNALKRLQARRTLPQLVQALENPGPSALQTHLAILEILESFLNEAGTKTQVMLDHYDPILEAIISTFSSNYASQIQQQALKILVKHTLAVSEQARSSKVIEVLIGKLSQKDRSVIFNVVEVLKQIGKSATQMLLTALAQTRDNNVRVRIIEILEYVRNPQALNDLLRLVADPVPEVRQQLVNALCTFALSVPETIPGLIQQVLADSDERIARQSAIILGKIGEKSLDLLIEAFSSNTPGRTRLLVEQLEHISDPQGKAISKLVDLLDASQEDLLTLSVIHALSHYRSERVVPPLLKMLASSHDNFYVEASHGLSGLGVVALDGLLAALATEQEPMIQRIRQVMYYMSDFPSQPLIDTIRHLSNEQAQHIMSVFRMRPDDTAAVMAENLDHTDERTQNFVRQAFFELEESVSVPLMLRRLKKDPASRADCIAFLLRHPQEAVPELVSWLHDGESRELARDTLLQFGPQGVISRMIPGLDDPDDTGQRYAKQIILDMVHHQPEELPRVIQLLKQAHHTRASHAYESLLEIVTIHFASISVPALQKELENTNPQDRECISEAFNRLVHRGNEQSRQEAFKALLDALNDEKQRDGAKHAFIKIGEPAVVLVGGLITDNVDSVAQAARAILCEIAGPALPFIWTLYNDSDRIRRDIALEIFHRMATNKISDALVRLLADENIHNISMGLGLLLERVLGERARSGTGSEIISLILKDLQTRADELTTVRVIAWLLLLGGNIAADHLASVLQGQPDLQYHSNQQELLARTFLLLGNKANVTLLKILKDPSTSTRLKAEMAGILGMMGEYEEVRMRALAVSKHGYGTSTRIANSVELGVSLRALGGLLAGGRWNSRKLEEVRGELLRSSSSAGHKKPPEADLLDVLLGRLYTPIIEQLEGNVKELMENLRRESEARKKDREKHDESIQRLRREYNQKYEQFDDEQKKSLDEISQMRRDKFKLETENAHLQQRNNELASRNNELASLLHPQTRNLHNL